MKRTISRTTSRRDKMRGLRFLGMTILFIFASAVPALAQSSAFKDILNVGVVDIARIFEVFFEESRAVRDLQELRGSINTQIQILSDEIDVLKIAKVDAELQEDSREALRLEQEILNKEQWLQDFKSIKYRELKNREASLQNDEFLVEIVEAVRFVAIRDGFSLIVEKDYISALYIADEVDVTEAVLQHLFSQVGRKYP